MSVRKDFLSLYCKSLPTDINSPTARLAVSLALSRFSCFWNCCAIVYGSLTGGKGRRTTRLASLRK